jgi:uncharacterized membrane protein YfcA
LRGTGEFYDRYVIIFLFVVGVVGGALNSVAGGGSFIGLPALIYAGVPPVIANATTTMALWPASLSSVAAYRHDIRTPVTTLLVLCGISLAGGLIGALLLVRTSDTSFLRLLPWLLLVAAVTFTLGPTLTARWRTTGELDRHAVAPWAMVVQLAISIYGGYFGGGMGIMMLATFAISGMTDIHEMNGLKSILGATLNGIALLAFIVHGAIWWRPGMAMLAGGILGGYAGGRLARRIDRRVVRTFVVVTAWLMTAYFFVRQAG